MSKPSNSNVKPIPDGYHTATPYLIVKGAAQAIDFYKKAFGATETMRIPGPNEQVMHAEIKIGDSPIMLADEVPGMNIMSPQAIGGSPLFLMLYVENVDAVTEQATAAGAQIERPVKDQFYGDRSSTLLDPFGHRWTIATHIEDVSPEQMNERMAAMQKKGGPC